MKTRLILISVLSFLHFFLSLYCALKISLDLLPFLLISCFLIFDALCFAITIKILKNGL